MSDINRVNISLLKTYKSDFDHEKSNFKNSAYRTFSSSYLKNCGDATIKKMSSRIDALYKKIDTGYNNIDRWWSDYNQNVEELEKALSNPGHGNRIKESSLRNYVNTNLKELKEIKLDLATILTPKLSPNNKVAFSNNKAISKTGQFNDLYGDYNVKDVNVQSVSKNQNIKGRVGEVNTSAEGSIAAWKEKIFIPLKKSVQEVGAYQGTSEGKVKKNILEIGKQTALRNANPGQIAAIEVKAVWNQMNRIAENSKDEGHWYDWAVDGYNYLADGVSGAWDVAAGAVEYVWDDMVEEWEILKEGFGMMGDQLIEGFERLNATITTFGLSCLEGAGLLFEKLAGGVVILGAAFTSLTSTIPADILTGCFTGNWDFNATGWTWEGTRTVVENINFVTPAFDYFYDNTTVGQYLKEKTYGFDTVRSIGCNVGEMAATVALSVATCGLASGLSSTTVLTGIAATKGLGDGTRTAWKEGAGTLEGLIYGSCNATWEGAQYYVGAKIGQYDMFKNPIGGNLIKGQKASNALTRITLDSIDSGTEGFVQPMMKMIYQKGYYDENGNYIEFTDQNLFERYGELFDDNGGFNSVLSNAIVGGIGSVGGELWDLKRYFKQTNAKLDRVDLEYIKPGDKLHDIPSMKILEEIDYNKINNQSVKKIDIINTKKKTKLETKATSDLKMFGDSNAKMDVKTDVGASKKAINKKIESNVDANMKNIDPSSKISPEIEAKIKRYNEIKNMIDTNEDFKQFIENNNKHYAQVLNPEFDRLDWEYIKLGDELHSLGYDVPSAKAQVEAELKQYNQIKDQSSKKIDSINTEKKTKVEPTVKNDVSNSKKSIDKNIESTSNMKKNNFEQEAFIGFGDKKNQQVIQNNKQNFINNLKENQLNQKIPTKMSSQEIQYINTINEAIANNRNVHLTLQNTTQITSEMLNAIDDLSQVNIFIKSGFENPDGDFKLKYDDAEYINRNTYTGYEALSIVNKLDYLSSMIDMNLPVKQRAYQIYEILANEIPVMRDFEEYIDGHKVSASLRGLTANNSVGKPGLVCAGYATAFKELCSRSGIKCDYIRGDAVFDPLKGSEGKHAWNVILDESGEIIPVDVTWKACDNEEWFGKSKKFADTHIADLDEQFRDYEPEQIFNKPGTIRLDKHDDIFQSIIETMDQKYGAGYGIEALQNYVTTGDIQLITRTNNARGLVEQLDVLEIENYLLKNSTNKSYIYDELNKIKNTMDQKYGAGKGAQILNNYVKNQDINTITRTNNARYKVQNISIDDIINYLGGLR